MKYFDFDSLIDKYSVSFSVISSEPGDYDDLGEYHPGTNVTAEKQGAIIAISDTKIYRSDGMLTAKDRELFMKESLGSGYDKAHIAYDGNKYKVESMPNDNHEFTGVWAYILKWVSAFDDGGDS